MKSYIMRIFQPFHASVGGIWKTYRNKMPPPNGKPPYFTMSTSVVLSVNLRGSSCQPPYFARSTSVVLSVKRWSPYNIKTVF
ncbi:hypothetical protein HMPREF1475_01958 [Hoylesella oralis HGA0225]|nr:hypothetical protein HMPREF1475_01958 [Hoylesella oralis HGA0225]SHF83885.1 hypothetical protein SAMN05444288_1662 [Hoylesella oralis]